MLAKHRFTISKGEKKLETKYMYGLLNSLWYSRANPGAERQKCYTSIIPICYTKKIKFKIIIINDGLCQDLSMFVYFMIVIHHIHLSL